MKAVLVLVDLQEDYLYGPSRIQPPREFLVRRAALLLEGFRRRQLPVIHVWTTLGPDDGPRFAHWRKNGLRKCVRGTPGHHPPALLLPAPGEPVVHKRGFNAFTGSELESHLNGTGQDTVMLVGVHLHACVRTAAVECLERDYAVVIARDAVGTNAPILSAATERWLADRCAAFHSVADCLSLLDGRAPEDSVYRSPRATSRVLFELGSGDTDRTAAVEVARKRRREWLALPLTSRLDRIERLAKELRSHAPRLAERMAHDIGKPVAHGREEVHRAAATVDDVVGRARNTRPAATTGALVRSRPVGVVAIITPWNNPVALPIGKIAPALAYGDAVLWKPAPAGTLTARELMQLLHAAGIPTGLVQCVEGGANAAQGLALQDGVDAVTLTGSLQTGCALQEICAHRSVPLQAELGGNNAAIVWEEAGLEEAAAQVAWGAFAFAGQRCTANRRAIVPEGWVIPFVDAVCRAAARLRWGDPLDPATEIGPLISRARCDEMEWLLSDAQTEGAVQAVRYPHETPEPASCLASGTYARPTVVVCGEPTHSLVQEELMAPLLVVQPARDFDQALTLCNGVRQGLAAALFSQSPDHQRRFLEEIEAGILKLNTSTAGVDPSLPFGGWKASGLGPPEHGEGDVLFYQRLQAVYGSPPSP